MVDRGCRVCCVWDDASCMRLAVEMRHLRGVVSVAGGEARGYGGGDAREISSVELEFECTQRFIKLFAAAGAHYRHDVRTAREYPSSRKLRRAGAFFIADLTQCLDQAQVFFEIASLVARHADDANVALGIGCRGASAQQSARKHAVGGDADS